MIGQTLGSYRIVDKLGEGGMGVVYLAEHPLIGRKAAVKRLLPEFSNRRDVVDRFFNEARAAAMIKHSGIVSIIDFGYAEDGGAFIVMEYLEGESLTSRLAAGRIPSEQAIRLGRQAASALAAAHSAGIVHRDLKPDNIFIVPDQLARGGERVKILDFGIAKLAHGNASASVTRTGAVMGSPLYMSPEQCRDAGEVGPSSDIYSLGCVLYHMVCGQPPFVAPGVGEVIAKHIMHEPTPANEMEPSVTPALNEIIMRTLAKEEGDRYDSMKDLQAALKSAVGGADTFEETGPYPTIPQPSAPGPTVPPSGPIVVSETTLGSAASQVAGDDAYSSSQGRPKWLFGVAALVLVGAAGVAYVTMKGGGGDEARPAAAKTDDSPPVKTTPPPPAAESKTVSVDITSTPSWAEVYGSDGVRVGTTPFKTEVDKASADLAYVIKLAGYDDQRVVLSGLEGGARAVSLVRTEKRRKKPSRTATKPKTKTKTKTETKPQKKKKTDVFVD